DTSECLRTEQGKVMKVFPFVDASRHFLIAHESPIEQSTQKFAAVTVALGKERVALIQQQCRFVHVDLTEQHCFTWTYCLPCPRRYWFDAIQQAAFTTLLVWRGDLQIGSVIESIDNPCMGYPEGDGYRLRFRRKHDESL